MPFPARGSEPRIVVVGAGISGLVCAYRLKKAGYWVRVLEQSHRVGGVIQTEHRQDCLLEHGPQSFQISERLAALLAELGLEAELVCADPRAPRYIYLRGRLHRVPLGPGTLLSTSLLSLSAKLALLREPFRARGDQREESVAEFIRRRFNAEILERLVEPFLSGVYAGDPERLSLQAVLPELARFEASAGSVIRGFIKSRKDAPKGRRTLCSFREGLSQLTERLATRLGDSLMCAARVATIRRAEAGPGPRYILEVERNGQNESLESDGLVLATPAWESARLVRTVSPGLAEILAGWEFAPLVVAWFRYRKSQVPRFPGGFGFLVPRTERMALRGTIFSSELFPGRAPADCFCFTCFVGGLLHPETPQLSEGELTETVSSALGQVLAVEGPGALLGLCLHEKGLPQYTLGHHERCHRLEEQQGRLPGLFLTGNYVAGISIPSCVEHAASTAERIASSDGGTSWEHRPGRI